MNAVTKLPSILPIIVAVWLGFFGRYSGDYGWARWALPAMLLYLALSFGFGIPFKSKRAYKQRKDLQRPCSFSIGSTGLYISSEGLAGTKPWTDYLKWKEGKTLFLVYLSDNLYQVIPKRFFASESDLNAFREVLSQEIPRREA